jgi:peptide/nickel transport system substrate-binding protein
LKGSRHTYRIGAWIILLLVLLSGCSGKAADEERPGTLYVGLESAPKTLDPRFATDAAGMRITQGLLFDTLVRLDDQLKIVSCLAQRWENPDNRTYIFHLRPSVKFHDGEPLTAEDVQFTFQHLMDPATGSPFAATYSDVIEAISVLNPQTVKFTLKQPTAAFLTSAIMPILPRHLLDRPGDFATRLIGSGPFRFVSQSPTEIVLARNADYMDGPPALERVVFKIIKDDNTRYLKAQKGELDLLVNAIAGDRIDDFKKAPLSEHYSVIESPGISYNYLIFNLDDARVGDLRVRRAVAAAIDAAEIIRYRLGGHAVRAHGLLSPVSWFAASDLPAPAHDPDMARRLLDQAGWHDPDGDGPRVRLNLELKTNNNAQVVGIARILQAQLSRVGIALSIKAYEWGTFYGDIQKGNFQIAAMRWVGVTEPDFFYDIFHASQVPPVGRNRGHFRNPAVDRLVAQGRVTLDDTQRKAIYDQVQRIVAEQLPYLSLWHLNTVSIVNRRVKGYRQHPMGALFSLKDVHLEQEKTP